MTADELVAYWARLGQDTIHPDDRAQMRDQPFATRLHPVPWAGPLRSAKAYLLYLNPGLASDDEDYERRRPDFVDALRDNLKGDGRYPYLLARFRDHSGYGWARTVFGSDLGEPECDQICVLQLVPYHSESGNVARRVARSLPSSKAVRSFVLETVLPKAEAGSAAVVVARSAALWGVQTETYGVVVYRHWECRRAFMTLKSRGGQLLIRAQSEHDQDSFGRARPPPNRRRTERLDVTSRAGWSVPSRSCPPRTPRGASPAPCRWRWR